MGETLYNRKRSIPSGNHRLLTLVLLFVLPFLQTCGEKPKEIRLLFTGDILLSRNVQTEIEQRNSDPWKNLKRLFRSADLVMGNLEGAVGNAVDSISSASGSPVFDIPGKFIPLLSEAAFNVLSIENNHSRDLGDTGKFSTAEALYRSNISPVSFKNSPQFFKVKDVNIAMVAINLVPDRDNSIQKVPSVELLQKLRMAKNLSNVVVVFIHWGSELLDWPNQTQRDAADWLTKNGADLIIGSHPHVVQKPELKNGKPVFFSLGNHLFDQKYAATKEGLIADCRISNGKLKCTGILTHTSKSSFYPEISGEREYGLPSVKLRAELKISGLSLEGVTNAATKERTILKASADGKKAFTTHAMPVLTVDTTSFDGKNEYLFTLEKHYSNMDGEIGIRPYVYSVTKNGLTARWRGSALAWPLLDAIMLPGDYKILCALHRGDSFMKPDTASRKRRTAAYEWNGFGFTGIADTALCKNCEDYYKKTLQIPDSLLLR